MSAEIVQIKMYHIDWRPDRGGVADADLFVGGEGSGSSLAGSSSDGNMVGKGVISQFMRRGGSSYEGELNSSSQGVFKRDPYSPSSLYEGERYSSSPGVYGTSYSGTYGGTPLKASEEEHSSSRVYGRGGILDTIRRVELPEGVRSLFDTNCKVSTGSPRIDEYERLLALLGNPEVKALPDCVEDVLSEERRAGGKIRRLAYMTCNKNKEVPLISNENQGEQIILTCIIQVNSRRMPRPVTWESCCFSSSLGYGLSA